MPSQGKLRYLAPCGKDIPVTTADSFKSRFLGLMGKKESYYGLLIVPCNSIHTCFMRYTMDAIFLDKNNTVVALKRFIKPFRFVLPVQGAVKVLEFPSSLNASAFLMEGTKINLYDIDHCF